ncbi:MAG TPA: hypothetical protein VGL96_07075 [Casimicrobiaceae bacterium]
MHAPSIRPRTAIEIVDASVSLFRENFKTLAVIALAGSVPFIAAIIAGVGMFSALRNPMGFMSNPMMFLPGMFGFGIVMLVWMAVVDGAMTFAAAEAYHGRRPTPADAFRGAIGKGLSLVGGNLLRMLIIGGAAGAAGLVVALLAKASPVVGVLLGFIVLVLAIHLLARTFAITSAIVIENQSAVEGVNRSFFLSKNATARIVGVALLCLMIYWFAQMVSMMLVQGVIQLVLHSPIVAAVAGNLAAMLIYPFLNVAIMVLYYDQRVRKEGYDLDVLTNAMPTPAVPRG